MNKDSRDLSSSQYAFRNSIALTSYFYDENDYEKSRPVYHNFKDHGKVEVGRRFDEYIYALDCFPRKYKETPDKSTLIKMLSAISVNLGFLNKDKENKMLLSYLFRVIDNKYYMYGYEIDVDSFSRFIEIGKDLELEEMNLNTRRYMWHENHLNLKKSIKSSIMLKDRFKETVTRNTELIFDTVTDLLENYQDFISNELISKETGLPKHTISRYIKIHEDRISKHNKTNYGTDDYNKYVSEKNIGEVKHYIINANLKNEKIKIKDISEKLNLHRNTVSKIIKNNDLL